MVDARDFDSTGLSEEELEAIGEEWEEPVSVFESDEDEADAPEPAAETPAEAEGEKAEPAPAPEPEKAETPEPPAAVQAAAPEQPREFTPQVGLPPDFKQQWDQVQADIAALGERWDAGDIGHKEYHAELVKLTGAQAQLTAAAVIAQQQAQTEAQRWEHDAASFLAEAQNAPFQNPVLHGALSAALNQLYADPANSGRGNRWYLQEAAKTVREALGQSPNAAEPESAPAPTRKPKAPLKPPHEAIPPTLGEAPTAGTDAVRGDKFAHIDSLKGAALERALERMSDNDVDEYLNTRAIHG